jgi:hypothetical protein
MLDILGDWWDSFLYSGRLYLVTLDGDVWEVDWPRLIESLAIRPRDRLGLELSFIDARFMYGRDWERLMRDEEIRDLLAIKINRIANAPIEVDEHLLRNATVEIYRSVLPEALSDLDVYRNRIYTAGEGGLNMASRHRLRYGSERQWDGEVLRLRASHGMLALAAGPEGLRQAPLFAPRGRIPEPWKVLSGDFTGCSWVSSSIFASSHSNAGVLAVFSHRRRNEDVSRRRQIRRFEVAIDDETLFDDLQRRQLDDLVGPPLLADDEVQADPADLDEGDIGVGFESRYAQPPEITAERHGFSWAGQGLICRAQAGNVEMVSYQSRPTATKEA